MMSSIQYQILIFYFVLIARIAIASVLLKKKGLSRETAENQVRYGYGGECPYYLGLLLRSIVDEFISAGPHNPF
ncbi:MAG: hypothetical protein EZS28_031591 [Streblomastix strix]|uniref:Uncharacterized protein n=1 Tax=Streblomastix strix TaxID=222440 RepID=A0A5J4USH8_9EUKA|nr:MAG: hypothetical protein EZS28_031591 [Streblomastix strix]